MEERKITSEEIANFIEGRDPEERIVNLEYSSRNTYVTVYYRDKNDNRRERQEPFYPFCWATLKACHRLCDGNRSELQFLMRKYAIGCKKLSQTSIDGEERHEFDDGYRFLFYAKKAMTYQSFQKFFKDARNPLYPKDSERGNLPKDIAKQYLVVSPQEQFLISTGKRFFKGYDDYDQLLRLIFDLETTGLDTRKDRIEQIGIRTNRPCNAYPEGFQKILTTIGTTEEEKDASELANIEEMLEIIKEIEPDIITGHNIEAFDWEIIIGACDRIGVPFDFLSEKHLGRPIVKDSKNTVLKLGGEMEYFKKTQVPKTIVTDSLHAVRRAQALDSNMLRADLKYVTEYSKMKKENRVYVPGEKISETWNDKNYQFAFCEKNGDWYKYDPSLNDEDNGELNEGKKSFIPVHGFIRNNYELKSGQYVVERYLFDDLYEADKVEYRYNTPNFLICKMLPVPYARCVTMGTAVQWKAIMLAWSYENGLAIPMFGERKNFSGGLSRLLSVGYVKKVAKFDFNSLYPAITLTWGIAGKNDLMNSMLFFLEYVLSQREKYKKLKKIAGKKKEEFQKKIKEFNGPSEEKELLEKEYNKYAYEESFNDKKQLPLKILGNSYFGSLSAPNVFPFGDIKLGERITCTGRQSLRLMIHYFNELGYEPIVGDTDGFNFKLPEESKYRYTKEHPYISTGLSRETEKGKKYIGFKADVAEFNDLYMSDKHYSPNAVNKMGLGIDEVVDATVNFSRKNYADYFPENPYPEDVKLVGNTVKSKKMPEYISKFLGIGIRLILRGDGQSFLKEYYDYIEKIYNYKIPLRDIASKGKFKKSLEEYKKDVQTLTKAGRPKSRQAWYELALKDKLTVNMGETLYYINTGTQKSHSDIKKVTNYYMKDGIFEEERCIDKDIAKKWKEEKDHFLSKEDMIKQFFPKARKKEEVLFNCRVVPRNILDKEEDTFCSDLEEDIEYNVPKYIDVFNKRIKPLLVCFKKEIRDNILIENPKDRPYFTEEQCQLTAGEPNKPTDQDTYEQLMTMEDKEKKFWVENNLVPPFFEECHMGNWEEVAEEYKKKVQEEIENGVALEKEEFEKILNSLTEEEKTKLLEDEEVPARITKLGEIDYESGDVISKKLGKAIGNMVEVYEAAMLSEDTDELEESVDVEEAV